MPGSVVKDIKFGFWVGAGFLLLGLVVSFIMAASMMAVGRK